MLVHTCIFTFQAALLQTVYNVLYLEFKQTETKTTELCMVSLKRTEEDFGTRLFTIGRFPFQWLVGGTRQVN